MKKILPSTLSQKFSAVLLQTTTWLAGLFAGYAALLKILHAPFFVWNGVRLAWTFSLRYGYKLYYGLHQGPILSVTYGPLAAWAYLPATVIHSVTASMILGSLLSVCFCVLPVFWLFLRTPALRTPHARFATGYAFVCFALLCLVLKSLRYSVFAIHADAPAIGFSLLSCLPLLAEKPNRKQLLFSAIAAVCAVWTKQTFVPVIIALPVYLLLKTNLPITKCYLCYLFFSGIVLSLFFIHLFPIRDLMLYLFQIPMRTPWEFKGPAPVAIWKALLSGWMEIVPLFFTLTLYTIYKVRRSQGIRHLFTQSAWPLFFMIAVFMIPTSLLGRVKIGGAINCLSPTSFFLAVAFSLVLKDLFLSAFHDGKHNGKSFMTLIFTIFPVMLIVLFLPELKTIKAEVDDGLWQNEQQLAYHMMKQHPGQIYAPSLPLASLLADGKLYHHDYGVFDRCFNTKFNVSQNHFRAHLPQDMRWIVLTDPIVWACHVKFYREFSQEVSLPGAPGKVFMKKDEEAPLP